MRLYEFANDDKIFVYKLYSFLKNLRGRSASKGAPAEFNWGAVDELFPDFKIDYEVFDKIFQSNQSLFDPIVHDYSGTGIKLDVPGTNKDTTANNDKETSQDKVNDIAASNAEKNLD